MNKVLVELSGKRRNNSATRRRAEREGKIWLIIRPYHRYAEIVYDCSPSSVLNLESPDFGLEARLRVPESGCRELVRLWRDYLRERSLKGLRRKFVAVGSEFGYLPILKEDARDMALKVAAVLERQAGHVPRGERMGFVCDAGLLESEPSEPQDGRKP